MHLLINKICLIQLDKQPDGNYSGVTGHVLAVDDVGLMIERDSDGQRMFIQWPRIIYAGIVL